MLNPGETMMMDRLNTASVLLSCGVVMACAQPLPEAPPDLYSFEEQDGWTSAGLHGEGQGYGYEGGAGGDADVPPPPEIPCEEALFTLDAPEADGVWVTGTFVDWAVRPEDGAWEMALDPETGLWTLPWTFDEAQFGQHHYAFIVDGLAWVADPDNALSVSNHRDGTWSVLNVCDTAPAPPCGAVHFAYSALGATTVDVAGDLRLQDGTLHYWDQSPVAMTEVNGTWHVVLALDHGSAPYKFVIDGAEWVKDPTNPVTMGDGFGGVNSVVAVNCTAGGSWCGDLDTFDWRDAVLYFAMVDRFHDSDGVSDPVPGASGFDGYGSSAQYEGGDLAGVTAKLDYLHQLGVSAIWLSAPYENRDEAGWGMSEGDTHSYSAYHGYWPSPPDVDFSTDPPTPMPEVESRIGSAEDLHELIDSAHGTTSPNGHPVRVLFDYVMNHVDDQSGLFEANPDWFYPTSEDYLCTSKGWGIDCMFTTYLPAFDFYNDEARKWSVDDALWWAREFDVDGYRLDAIKHVPMSWLTDLRSALNAEFPEPAGDRFYLVGETYTWGEYDVLASFVDPDTMLDGQFDFPWRKEVCNATMADGTFTNLRAFMDYNDTRYGPGALMSTWLGNHDIPRVIHAADGVFSCTDGSGGGIAWTPNYPQPTTAEPYDRFALGFAILLTNPGLPLLYYGDEIGLAGGGDPDNRRVMPWDDSELTVHQLTLRDRFQELAWIRAENKALSRGVRSTLEVDPDLWVYRMGGCGVAAPDVVVGLNRSDSEREMTLPEGSWEDLLLAEPAEMTETSQSIAPRGYRVFRAVVEAETE